jgi:hypothetical protein
VKRGLFAKLTTVGAAAMLALGAVACEVEDNGLDDGLNDDFEDEGFDE